MQTGLRFNLIFVAVLIGLFLLFTPFGLGASIIVDDDLGPWADYQNIQDAIDNSTDGEDTILVYNGTYLERVEVDKSINIFGNSSVNTTIDGQFGRAMWITTDWVNVSGFSMVRSHNPGSAMAIDGDHCLIFRNHFSRNDDGIYMYDDSNTTIFENIFTQNSGMAINLDDADNYTIRDNYFTDNSGRSIWVGSGSFNCKVINNTVVNNDFGSANIQGDFCIIQGNYFYNNSGGIGVSGEFSIASNNTFDYNRGRGLGVGGSNNTIRDNICTNNSWEAQDGGIYVSGVHNFINNNTCKWNSYGLITWSARHNFIRQNDFTYSNNSGIWIREWSAYNDIVNNNFGDNGVNGIIIESKEFWHAENNRIRNNNCSNNGLNGIWIKTTTRTNWIMENKCENNTIGVNITSSRNAELNQNYCDWNDIGIYLYDSFDNLLLNDSCSDNIEYGIYLESSDFNSIYSTFAGLNTGDGIRLKESNNNTINRCNVINNSIIGINIWSSDNNNITNNAIPESGTYGIKLDNASHNLISGNNITQLTPSYAIPKGFGLLIESSSTKNLIVNNSIYGGEKGLYIWSSINNWIVDNTFENSTFGIHLNGNDCEVESNTIIDNDIGINISWRATQNIVTNNRINNNDVGIYVFGLTTSHQGIHFNNISGNKHYGIQTYHLVELVNATFNWWGDGSGPFHLMNNTDGKGDNVTDNVTFDPWLPHAVIQSISPNPSMQGDLILFKGKGLTLGLIEQYSWHSDIDGELHNGTNSSFSSYLTNGSHNITFKIKATLGGWTRGTITPLEVNGEPIGAIKSIHPTYADEAQPIDFIGSGIDDGSIERYQWSSNIDGILYDGPSYTFSSTNLTNGSHEITLRVQDDLGAWSNSVHGSVYVNGLPRAIIIELSPDNPNEGANVTFTCEGIDDGIIEQYHWTSDIDGNIYNGVEDSFSISSLSNGTHVISLNVLDNNGSRSFDAITSIQVNGLPLCQIVNITPIPIMIDENVTFVASSIDDQGDIRHLWNSTVDGVLYDGPNSTFVSSVLSNGSHTISLVVQDNHGAWSEVDTQLIILSGTPEAIIVGISPNASIEGAVVTFTGTGIDDISIQSYHWQSDLDGHLYNGSNSSFDLPTLSNGTHNITLRVMNSFSVWSNWTNQRVTVNGRPRAFIVSVNPNPLEIGEQLALQARGVDDDSIVRYIWSSSVDNEIANGTNENLTADSLSEGSATITLNVLDNEGVWSSSDSMSLIVNQPPRITIGLPLNRSIVSDEIYVNGTMTDTFGTEYYVQISIDYGEWIEVTGTSNWNYILHTTELENAQHLIRVRAYDGYHYSRIHSITIETENDFSKPDDGGDSSDNSLMLVAVLGIIIGILVTIVGYFMFKSRY